MCGSKVFKNHYSPLSLIRTEAVARKVGPPILSLGQRTLRVEEILDKLGTRPGPSNISYVLVRGGFIPRHSPRIG